MIVNWCTDALVNNSQVKFGVTSGQFTQFVNISTATTEHIVQLDWPGLLTRYYCSIAIATMICVLDTDNVAMILQPHVLIFNYI